MGGGVNYFPFHLGDYAAHTAHLEPMEDLAYRRLLDWYYLNEKALPEEVAKVARLIRMPKSVAVIEAVLAEFFVKADDGWHNKRADLELASMAAKQEQQGAKDEHEAERMKRHRERRSQMFAALRQAGVVPAWDVPMKELQRLFNENCNAPATDLQREQAVTVNASATAIPTPTPTPTVCGEPDGAHTLPEGFAEVLKTRPELAAQVVYRKFCDHKPEKQRTLTTWRKWVADEHTPEIVPAIRGPDPELERIKRESKQAAPPSLEVLARMAKIRQEARAA